MVGFDSGNSIMTAFNIADDGSLTQRWPREQAHASHLQLFPAVLGRFLAPGARQIARERA